MSDDIMRMWDAFIAADAARLRHQLRIDELNRKLHWCQRRCGNCNHWMIKPDCPIEAQGTIVSMNDPACASYVEKDGVTQERDTLIKELTEIMQGGAA